MQKIQAARLAVDGGARREADGDESIGVLARLACLPAELQDAVIGHLPLADILVWEKLNRHFCHRVRLGRLRERALGRTLCAIVGRAAFSRENHDRLLRPWLAGFAANPLGPDWPRTLFCPDTLQGAVIRTLKETPRLNLAKQASFPLPGIGIREPAFSPTGNYLTVRTVMESAAGTLSTPVHIFSWTPEGWQPGSPFSRAQGVYGLCFSADERQVAVAQETEVAIWNKRQGCWSQVACLVPDNPLISFRLHMGFSPDGQSLLLHSHDGHLSVWDRDDGHHWQLGGHFLLATDAEHGKESVFSPDGRWLLAYDAAQQFVFYSRRADAVWRAHPPLQPRGQLMAEEAVFRPGHCELLLRLEDDSLSLWRLHKDCWYETGAVHHPQGICSACFSGDGQYLVTEAIRCGTVLWAETSEGQWTVQHSLYRVHPERDVFSFVHFDPGGQWLISGNYLRSFGESDELERGELVLWAQGGSGRWQLCPEGSTVLLGAKSLQPGADGQHLALLTRLDAVLGQQGLKLLAWHGGRWVVKAETQTTWQHFYADIAMDPFCCYLAAVTGLRHDGRSGVDFLRVQAAPAPD